MKILPKTLALLAVLALPVALSSCGDDDPIEATEEALDDAGDALEDAGEAIGDTVEDVVDG